MHAAIGAIDQTSGQPLRHGLLERLFHLQARGSTPGTEVLAGLTTFATMAFVLVVNPVVMAGAGMDRADLIIATAAAAAIGSLLVAVIANQPLAAAPAMGSNVVFASVLVGQLGVPWQAGLAMVLTTGALFLALSLSGLRERMMHALPPALQAGIQGSVGVLIILMALRSGHMLVRAPELPAWRPVMHFVPGAWLALAGMAATLGLTRLRVPGALLLSIIVLALAGLWIPGADGHALTHGPAHPFAWPHWPAHTALQLDFGFLARHMLLCAPLMLYFFCSEFFSTLGTVIGTAGIGTSNRAGSDAAGTAALAMTPVFVADALATIIGPLLGTAVVTVFVESAAGIQVGGRTGLTALVAALGFAAALGCGPLLMAIPAEATAPAMLAVGLMMLGALRRIDLRRLDDALPVAAALGAALLTGNLLNSIACGTGIVLALTLARRNPRAASPMLWAMGALFAAYYLLSIRLF